MSRFILGDCVQVMSRFPARAVDFILTDPPYLVGYKDRTGRTLAGDNSAEWLQPACHEMYRVLKNDSLMVSFYAWNRADLFLNAWKTAGFRVVGHIVFAKSYASKSTFVGYTHESAYLLAKGRPQTPDRPIPDVIPWKYTGNGDTEAGQYRRQPGQCDVHLADEKGIRQQTEWRGASGQCYGRKLRVLLCRWYDCCADHEE